MVEAHTKGNEPPEPYSFKLKAEKPTRIQPTLCAKTVLWLEDKLTLFELPLVF